MKATLRRKSKKLQSSLSFCPIFRKTRKTSIICCMRQVTCLCSSLFSTPCMKGSWKPNSWSLKKSSKTWLKWMWLRTVLLSRSYRILNCRRPLLKKGMSTFWKQFSPRPLSKSWVDQQTWHPSTWVGVTLIIICLWTIIGMKTSQDNCLVKMPFCSFRLTKLCQWLSSNCSKWILTLFSRNPWSCSKKWRKVSLNPTAIIWLITPLK